MLRKISHVVRKKTHVVRKKFYVASIFHHPPPPFTALPAACGREQPRAAMSASRPRRMQREGVLMACMGWLNWMPPACIVAFSEASGAMLDGNEGVETG